MTSSNVSKTQPAFISNNKRSAIKFHECGKIGHKRSKCWKLRNLKHEKNALKCQSDKDFNKRKGDAFSAMSGYNVANECALSNELMFYLDSGASQHMVFNENCLKNISESETRQITVANNEKLQVKSAGDMTITIEILMDD